MRLSFTGTREHSLRARVIALQYYLDTLHDVIEEGVHGACTGSDDLFDETCAQLRIARHAYPSTLKNRISDATMLQRTGSSVLIEQPCDPLVRNIFIVDRGLELLAMPRTFQEELRSGTWHAIRYARRQRRRITFIWPNGTITTEVP